MAIEKQLYVLVQKDQNYRIIKSPYKDLSFGDPYENGNIVCKTDYRLLADFNELIWQLNTELKAQAKLVSKAQENLNAARLNAAFFPERNHLDNISLKCDALNKQKEKLREMREQAQGAINVFILEYLVKQPINTK